MSPDGTGARTLREACSSWRRRQPPQHDQIDIPAIKLATALRVSTGVACGAWVSPPGLSSKKFNFYFRAKALKQVRVFDVSERKRPIAGSRSASGSAAAILVRAVQFRLSPSTIDSV